MKKLKYLPEPNRIKELKNMIEIEIQTSPSTWRTFKVKQSFTSNMNLTFVHEDKKYVFKKLINDTPVFVLENGAWVKAGRVTHGRVLLGDGESYEECMEKQPRADLAAQLRGFKESLRAK
jgi:hypothetical protein